MKQKKGIRCGRDNLLRIVVCNANAQQRTIPKEIENECLKSNLISDIYNTTEPTN